MRSLVRLRPATHIPSGDVAPRPDGARCVRQRPPHRTVFLRPDSAHPRYPVAVACRGAPGPTHIPGIPPPRCFRGIISKMCAVRGHRMAGYAGSAGAHLGYFARRRRTSRILCREFAGVAGYRGSALIQRGPNRYPWQNNRDVRCPGGAIPGGHGGMPGKCAAQGRHARRPWRNIGDVRCPC